MYLKRGEGKDTLKTNEGVKAVDEAINELYEQTRLHELKEHDHLTELTNTFVQQLGAKGSTDPFVEQQNGSQTHHKDFVKSKEGNILEHYGFSVQLHGESAEEIVCMMLVDDGLTMRSRRKNIFKKEFNLAAVSVHKHRDLKQICGIAFCQGYFKQGEPHPLDGQVKAFLATEDDYSFPQTIDGSTGAYT